MKINWIKPEIKPEGTFDILVNVHGDSQEDIIVGGFYDTSNDIYINTYTQKEILDNTIIGWFDINSYDPKKEAYYEGVITVLQYFSVGYDTEVCDIIRGNNLDIPMLKKTVENMPFLFNDKLLEIFYSIKNTNTRVDLAIRKRSK